MDSLDVNVLDYDLIAIDMDNTLVKYRLNNTLPLIHRLIQNHLIQSYGYSEDIRQEFDPKYCQKGLVIDKRRGNVLKLDAEYRVMSARHGFTRLSEETIRGTYDSEEGVRQELRQIVDELSAGTINKKGSAIDFAIIKDFFTSPAAQVFAKCVEVLDNNHNNDDNTSQSSESQPAPPSERNYCQIWTDIYGCLCVMYERQQFRSRVGGWFPEVIARPELYIEKCTQRVRRALEGWRRSGAHVVLVTSSDTDYARHLMSHSFGDQWIRCFDFALTFARKPTFFTDKCRPFLALDSADRVVGPVAADELRVGRVYSEGNWNQLRQLVAKRSAKSEPKCLYIGDSFTDDCIVPNRYADCHTIAIVEELDEHIRPELDSRGYWESFFADTDSNATLWAHLLAKHTRLMVADMDSLSARCLTAASSDAVTTD